MPDRGPGLKVQAAHLIAENTLKDQLLQVLINKCGDNDKVEVTVENLISLRINLEANSKLIQKQSNRIEDLNNQLFNA